MREGAAPPGRRPNRGKLSNRRYCGVVNIENVSADELHVLMNQAHREARSPEDLQRLSDMTKAFIVKIQEERQLGLRPQVESPLSFGVKDDVLRAEHKRRAEQWKEAKATRWWMVGVGIVATLGAMWAFVWFANDVMGMQVSGPGIGVLLGAIFFGVIGYLARKKR